MYNFNKKIYKHISELLLARICQTSFTYATFEFEDESILIRFGATIFPSLEQIDYPEGSRLAVVDLTPVWWSVRTFRGGEELLNDFDFSTLKEVLCHR